MRKKFSTMVIALLAFSLLTTNLFAMQNKMVSYGDTFTDLLDQDISTRAIGLVSGEQYYIQSAYAGRFVDVDNNAGSPYTNSKLEQWDLDTKETKKWEFISTGDGYFKIKSSLKDGSTELYMSVKNNSSANDTDIILAPYTAGDGQKWKIGLVEGDRVKIIPKCGENVNRVLRVNNSLWEQNGLDIKLYNYTDDSNYKDEWILIRTMPLSGYELPYNPSLWEGVVKDTNNCYAYILNNQVYPGTTSAWFKQQPGRYAGLTLTQSQIQGNGQNILYNVLEDFEAYNENFGTNLVFNQIGRFEKCPPGSYKVALVVNPGVDYHWYRQDADGFWSHKQGTTAVKRTDGSNQLIIDPILADRGDYTSFVAYFKVTPWNNYFTSGGIVTYSIEDAFVNKIDRNSLNLITIGMSYSEVTAILGSCGVDAEFGIAAFQYETTDGDIFYISYIENENHELIVAEIYQKE